jgi:hypothetical protein
VNITPLPHEETRFTVESVNTLRCGTCHREFRRTATGVCKRCMVVAPAATYLVDVVEFWGRGRCSCPDYRCRVQPFYEVKDFTPKPCKHQFSAFYLFGCQQAIKRGEAPQEL